VRKPRRVPACTPDDSIAATAFLGIDGEVERLRPARNLPGEVARELDKEGRVEAEEE
jgi:hypothetical protein